MTSTRWPIWNDVPELRIDVPKMPILKWHPQNGPSKMTPHDRRSKMTQSVQASQSSLCSSSAASWKNTYMGQFSYSSYAVDPFTQCSSIRYPKYSRFVLFRLSAVISACMHKHTFISCAQEVFLHFVHWLFAFVVLDLQGLWWWAVVIQPQCKSEVWELPEGLGKVAAVMWHVLWQHLQDLRIIIARIVCSFFFSFSTRCIILFIGCLYSLFWIFRFGGDGQFSLSPG